MKYDLAIFDLDGTLLDTLEDLARSVNHVLSANGYPTRSTDEIRWFVGSGMRMLIRRALPEGTPEEQIGPVLAQFMEYYDVHKLDHTVPYAGINALLDSLRKEGILLAMVSNKADPAVQQLAGAYFPGMFAAVAGARDTIRRKPAPDMADAVLASLCVSRERAVYIGDSEVDIETAGNAGMDLILVTWGFREKAYLMQAGGTVFAENPPDLLALIGKD